MIAPRSPAPSPPKGFRKAIPIKTVLECAIAQAVCPDCGLRLGHIDNVHRDHCPPLAMRTWDDASQDTIPAANDPKFIVLRHVDCHKAKTSGGKTRAKAQGDVTEIARTRRLGRAQEEFRSKVLAKGEDAATEPQKARKRQWPKRKMGRVKR